MGGARFFDKIAAIETYPYLKNILNMKVSHVLMINKTVNFLQNSVVLEWLRKYKMGNPLVLLGDLALSLVSEGCKRWFYLYLHDEITIATNFIYAEPPTVAGQGKTQELPRTFRAFA